jgi:hypothetical protein
MELVLLPLLPWFVGWSIFLQDGSFLFAKPTRPVSGAALQEATIGKSHEGA